MLLQLSYMVQRCRPVYHCLLSKITGKLACPLLPKSYFVCSLPKFAMVPKFLCFPLCVILMVPSCFTPMLPASQNPLDGFNFFVHQNLSRSSSCIKRDIDTDCHAAFGSFLESYCYLTYLCLLCCSWLCRPSHVSCNSLPCHSHKLCLLQTREESHFYLMLKRLPR